MAAVALVITQPNSKQHKADSPPEPSSSETPPPPLLNISLVRSGHNLRPRPRARAPHLSLQTSMKSWFPSRKSFRGALPVFPMSPGLTAEVPCCTQASLGLWSSQIQHPLSLGPPGSSLCPSQSSGAQGPRLQYSGKSTGFFPYHYGTCWCKSSVENAHRAFLLLCWSKATLFILQVWLLTSLCKIPKNLKYLLLPLIFQSTLALRTKKLSFGHCC